MKAGIIYQKNKIEYGEWETPQVSEGKVLVEVRACGVCGSDVPRVLGVEAHFYPIVIGHEFSGIVRETGAGVTTLKTGDRVAGVPLLPCIKCADCQNGDYALCKNYSFIGSREQGAFAEYVVVPEKNAVRFSEDVTFEQGAFFEPSTIALHGIIKSRFSGGGTVAILGGGTIGLFTALWAKIFGAERVFVLDISDDRLALARGFGIENTLNTANPGLLAEVKEATGGRGFDFVFETAGAAPTELLAFEVAGNKSRVTFIGTPHAPLTFSQKAWENMNRKEFILTGTWMSYSAPFPGREWTLTAKYFSDGRLPFSSNLIYKSFPLSKIKEAFALFENPQNVKGKILIVKD